MAIKNPIQFVSRTFNTILNDINSDSELADKPNWFKRIWAGIGDVISMWVNAMGNNLVLRTAYTRQNVIDLLELIDYNLAPQSTANGEILFYISSSAVFPFSVVVGDLIAQTAGSLAVSSKIFESRAGVTVTEETTTFDDGDVNDTTNIVTVSRVFTTGEKVILSGAGLPPPLAISTEYWIIKVSDTTIQFALTLADAYLGNAIDLTGTGSGTTTITMYSTLVQVYQQQSQSQRSVGESDGVTEWQDYTLGETSILEDTIEIEIDGDAFSKVDTLVFSESTDKDYEVIYDTDGIAIVRFGNGEYGAIPNAFDIDATFAIGGGSVSNVNAIDNINIYSGSDSNIVGVSNPTTITGGDDPEDIANGKRLGPILLKTRDRFVTSEDGQALAEDFGGVAQVIVNANEYGVLSAQVVIIPDGGGTTSTAFKSELQQYLIDRTVLESIDVRVFDATYLTQNVVSNVKVEAGFTFADIEDYIEIAWRLFFTETGLEITREYESNGIADTTTLINTIFGTVFGTGDYDQLEELVSNLDPRVIGVDIQESDAFGYIDSFVFGVDYIEISSPTFPVVLANDEITTDGTVALTEI